MAECKKQLKIAVSVALQDAGEATRSIEIMKSIRAFAPPEYYVHAVFFTHGSRFDDQVLENGFGLQRVDPAMQGDGYLGDLKPAANNFIGDKDLAYRLLKGEIAAIHECRPDLILHGFWPIAGVARRMVEPNIPAICFLPLPFEPGMYGSCLMQDVPDQIKPLTYLPEWLRRKIMKALPSAVKLKAPILMQSNILYAAAKCGWPHSPLRNLFDMLQADLTVVNDLPCFYEGVRMPERFILTGPLYSPAGNNGFNPEIRELVRKQNSGQINIFCTMGSSAKTDFLLEAVKAIVSLPAERFHAVILVPKAVCPIEETEPLIDGHANILITDQFVPAKLVNAQADVTVCHGGQGTIQTALSCGCPVVGFAMQPEQQINLDHVVQAGAGIRLPVTRWKKHNIRSAIEKIVRTESYRKNAVRLSKKMKRGDSRQTTASAIWNFIKNRDKRDSQDVQ